MPASSGIKIEARNPPSSRLANQMSPPCAVMMVRAIDRPSPCPPVSNDREFSSLKNGSNTRSRSVSGIPGPSSSTLIKRCSSRTKYATRGFLPYRAAFSITLRSARRMAIGRIRTLVGGPLSSWNETGELFFKISQ